MNDWKIFAQSHKESSVEEENKAPEMKRFDDHTENFNDQDTTERSQLILCSTIVNNKKHTAFGPSQDMKPTNPHNTAPLEDVKKALFKNYLDKPLKPSPTKAE